ncbi:hypothetical protein JA1_004892 [Spathaspora sp. JA1]|nr:hypothetical protein JA1_004892 [Spathaspora sp. JA1]
MTSNLGTGGRTPEGRVRTQQQPPVVPELVPPLPPLRLNRGKILTPELFMNYSKGKKQQQQKVNELDFKIAATATPEQQLLQLKKWLNFEVISVPKVDNSLGSQDLSVEYYELLMEFNKLLHLVCEKNNQLNIVKFKCNYLIDEMLRDYNNYEDGRVVKEGDQMKPYTDDNILQSQLVEKLQNLFDPKEEFDSTGESSSTEE